MKRLSQNEVQRVLEQLEFFIKEQSFDEAIKLSRNTLKTCLLPDKRSIDSISKQLRFARLAKKDSSAIFSPIKPLNYVLPKYRSFHEETEKKHLGSLINYIYHEKHSVSNNLHDEKANKHDKLVKPLSHEEIIQIGINKELRKSDLSDHKEKLGYFNKSTNRPFFARFDFNDKKSRKIVYISDTNTNRIINSYGNVNYVDWRAPITKAYYSYQKPIKNASYTVKKYGETEEITGDIDLVARYTIKNGTIKECVSESSTKVQNIRDINDEILQQKLRSSSGEHMKAHADTLQSEQYNITSFNPDEDLIIQGVAGSGKTVIALSRLVFLKYEENKNFSNDNILYISPNASFSEYVSNVSVGLGETRIPIKTMEDVINSIFETKKDRKSIQWESLASFAEKYRKEKPSIIKNKFSKSFINKFYSLYEKLENDIEAIEEYNSNIQHLNNAIKKYSDDITKINGDIKNYNKEKREFEKQYSQLPTSIEQVRDRITKKIGKGSTNVDSDLERLRTLENDLYIVKQGLKSINRQIKGTSQNIEKSNKQIEKHKKALKRARETFIRKLKCSEIANPNEKSDDRLFIKSSISNKTYIRINSANEATISISPEAFLSSIHKEKTFKKWAYENIPYYIIIKFLLEKANGKNLENRAIRHIVVDEAQDYTEPYFFFLRQAYPNAVFTILGDKNQNVNPFYKIDSLEGLMPDTVYKEINIAYRSSPEIVEYCNEILKLDNIYSKRTSQGFEVTEKKITKKNLVKTISEEIDRLRDLGFKRIAVITDNQKNSNTISTKLEKLQKDKKSAIVSSVFLSKGLEYDATIVIDNYKRNEKQLLYTACTRAQHALTVLK